MADTIEEFQKFGKDQIEATTSITASLAKGLQNIAAETSDYSKRTLEDHAAVLTKLLTANSFDSALQIQTEYANAAYESAVEQARKIGELYTNLTQEALKSVESAFAKVVATK